MKKIYFNANTTKLIIFVTFMLFSIFAKSQSSRVSCNNLDFSSGTTAGWSGAWCDTPSNSNYALPVSNLPTKGFNSSNGKNQRNYVHEIMTAGVDPLAAISRVPPGHAYSLRLGSDSALSALLNNNIPNTYPYNHQSVSNTFIVSAATPTINIWNAIVFGQSQMPHFEGEQPYFTIRLYDKNNSLVHCFTYQVNPTKGIVNGDFKTIPVANTTQPEQIVYRDWKMINIPLLDYIDQQVTIQIETSDCYLGGHPAYAYLAVDCAPFQKIQISSKNCRTDTVLQQHLQDFLPTNGRARESHRLIVYPLLKLKLLENIQWSWG